VKREMTTELIVGKQDQEQISMFFRIIRKQAQIVSGAVAMRKAGWIFLSFVSMYAIATIVGFATYLE